ncbi:hypothetical protein G6F43_010370 [Rhizopus delemar]|nr:hypothetical protein G6F43_010370 [Rhizopus delemar]
MPNVTNDKNEEIRLDITISKIHQREFRPRLGFGEVKLARSTANDHGLCHDHLCLATFAKDTLNKNKLQAALASQMDEFNLTFFL